MVKKRKCWRTLRENCFSACLPVLKKTPASMAVLAACPISYLLPRESWVITGGRYAWSIAHLSGTVPWQGAGCQPQIYERQESSLLTLKAAGGRLARDRDWKWTSKALSSADLESRYPVLFISIKAGTSISIWVWFLRWIWTWAEKQRLLFTASPNTSTPLRARCVAAPAPRAPSISRKQMPNIWADLTWI